MVELISSAVSSDRRVDPYITLWIETPRYVLKTVNRISELKDVLALRAKIFSSEYGAEISEHSLDVDPYDFHCDHLAIVDRTTDQVVGTYRILCSRFTNRFYSQTEFEIEEFLADDSVKLELGRACIEPMHRRGAVLGLLWRGITQYATRVGATYLFGCSSVKTDNFAEARALYRDMSEQGHLSNDWNIRPNGAYAIAEFKSIAPVVEAQVQMPSLFQSYIKAGAKVYGEPAYDAAFHCLDFLTVLKIDEISEQYERRYQR